MGSSAVSVYIPPININYGYTTNFNAVDSPIVVDENTNPLIHDYYSYGHNGFAAVARSFYRLYDFEGHLAEDNEYFYFDENMSLATGNENKPIEYSSTGSANSMFGVANNTGRLHFINPPDYETKNKYEVKVSLKNGPIKYDEFTIEINDVNEPLEITSNDGNAKDINLDENTSASTTVYQVYAIDEDIGDSITFSLKGEESSNFTIDSEGRIRFKDSPDYESKSSYSTTIEASDGEFKDTQDLNVNIVDINEAPVITSNSGNQKTVSWNENTPASTTVYDVSATDEDIGDSITFSLAGGDSLSFTIDTEGRIRFKDSPDYESKSSYSTTIESTDGELTDTQGLDVNIKDVNEAPVFTSLSTASAIDENTASSTVIYSATARDESAITWSLKEEFDYSKFSVDSNGNVALASSPDYEVDGSELKFTVIANDGTFNTSKTVTIGINDVLENEFIINPDNTTETKAKTLKAENTETSGITSSHLFNIHDVSGFGDKTWGSVRIPKKLRSVIDYQNDKTASDYGWLYFKTGKSQADLKKGAFRVFAKSEDNTVKQALKFKIKPDIEDVLSYQDQAINRLNSWNLSHTSKTWTRSGIGKNWSQISNVDSAVDNIFNKFKLDSNQENNFLDKFKEGSAKIAANTNNNMVIIDSSSTSDSIISHSEIKDVNRVIKTNSDGEDVTRLDQIKQALEAKGLTIADDVTIETPINELDFSVDTLANGSAIVQLQLEESDQNINRIIKTNNQDESFVFNSTIITYDPSKHGADFDNFIDGLQYSINYYDQPVDQDPNNSLTLNLTAGKNSDIDALLSAEEVPYRNYSIIDGSAFLIDKDGDGDIEMVSAFLLDQGFFDTDTQVGLIRDPIIPIVSPIPGTPGVDGSGNPLVNDATPNLTGTTDNSGNIINLYAEDGTTLLASTISGSDNTWSISDGDFSGNTIADGTHSLKVTASDDGGESTAADFVITIDTLSPKVDSINVSQGINGFSSNDESINVSFIFSEATTDFDINDIYLTGGDISRLSGFSGIGKSYSVTFTPDSDGTKTISIAGGAFTDEAGNTNDVSSTFTWTYDSTGPTITSSTTAEVNENIEVGSTVYTVTADDGSGTGVKANSFAITGTDAGLLTLDSKTGEVTIDAIPDYETKSSYSFTVAATDEVNNTTTKDVTLSINNIDDGSSTFEIRGIAKVGETMTVGYNLKETAVDADNSGNVLDGSYSYDWQLSDNGGESWTTVASDEDYKITTADVDKKLRALVSYTDEGGFKHTDIASSNSLDTVSLAAIAVDTNNSLIEYQYRLQKSGSDVDLGGVIGYSNDNNTNSAYGDISYDLIVEAKTLTNGDINGKDVIWDLESFDVTLDFNYDLFSNWDASGVSVSFGDEVNNAKSYDYSIDALSADSVRIIGATLSKLNEENGIQDSYKELFTLTGLKFDASGTKAFVDEGNQFVDVDISTNIYDTVVANYQSTDDDETKDNAYIKSLNGLGYTDVNDGGSVDDTTYKTYIHNAYVDLDEQGTTLYTQRSIGSNDKTYLIRDGSTVDAKAWWANLGNYGVKAEDVNLSISDTTNFKLMELSVGENGKYDFVSSYSVDTVTDLSGSELINGGSVDLSTGFDDSGNANKTSWDGSGSENIELRFKVQVDGKVGQRLDELETDFYTLEGKDTDGYESKSAKLTNNIITFQGDLNYDGRVSMKDLAYLNAGKLNAIQNGDQAADDVDADYDGEITTKDLTILDRDWGGTIHSDSLTTDSEWESKSWASLGYMDGDVINNISDTEVDYENSAFAAQKLIDSDHPDPLAGDIYSGEGDLYTGSNLFADDTKDFGVDSDPITGYDPT